MRGSLGLTLANTRKMRRPCVGRLGKLSMCRRSFRAVGRARRVATLYRMLGLGTLARVVGEVRRDVSAARERDPAARGVAPAEILASWPGVHALLAHRVAHGLHEAGVPLGVLSVKRIVHYLVEHFPATIYNLPPDPDLVPREPEGA